MTVTDVPFPLGLASLGNQHFQHGPTASHSWVPSRYVPSLGASVRFPTVRPRHQDTTPPTQRNDRSAASVSHRALKCPGSVGLAKTEPRFRSDPSPSWTRRGTMVPASGLTCELWASRSRQ